MLGLFGVHLSRRHAEKKKKKRRKKEERKRITHREHFATSSRETYFSSQAYVLVVETCVRTLPKRETFCSKVDIAIFIHGHLGSSRIRVRGEPISSGDVAVYPGDARNQDSPSGVFEVALRQALQHEQGRYDQACELERHVDHAHFRAGSAHD